MIFAPVFGYLGDRYSRKWIMAVGVGIWVLAVLVGSFMEDFTAFLIMRAIVGVGEASYSTIAPTIISDMFVKDARSKMLALFYFAIPVGRYVLALFFKYSVLFLVFLQPQCIFQIQLLNIKHIFSVVSVTS